MMRKLSSARISWALVVLLGSTGSLVVPTWAQSSDRSDPAERSYLSANGMLNRGLYELAAKEYREFLSQHGDHDKAPVARYGLGVSLFRMKRYEEAVKELGVLQDRDDFKFSAETRTLLGQAHLMLHAYPEAIEAFHQVIIKQIDHALADDATAGLAEAQYLAGDYESSVSTCEQFAKRWEDNPLGERVLFFHGLSAMQLQRFNLAADRFDTLLDRFERGPYSHQTTLLLAQCHQRDGSVKDALRQYQRVLKQSKSRYIPDALLGLAGLMQQLGEFRQAGELLDTLLDNFPDSPLISAALLQRGRVWFELGDYDQAAEILAKLLERDDRFGAEASYFHGKCSLRNGHFEQAAERLARAIKRFPTCRLIAEMHYDRAVSLVRAKKHDDAVSALQTFLSKFENHTLAAESRQLLASTEHQRKRYKESRKQAKRFLSKYPQHPLASTMAFLIGENEFLDQRFEQAVSAYQDYLKNFPNDSQVPTATFRLGMALFRLGQFDGAKASLEGIVDGHKTEDVFRPALLALGDLHFQRGEWKPAERYLSAYLTAGQDARSADDALLKLGLALQRQQREDEAVAVYDQLIEGFPDSPQRLQAIFEKGQSLVTLNRAHDARNAFQRVLDEGGDTRFAAYALNHLATIATQDKDYEEAAKLYKLAAKSDAQGTIQADAGFQQGMNLMAAQQFGKAEKAFDQFLAQNEDHPRVDEAQAQRAIALARQNQHAKAIEAINGITSNATANLEPSLKASLQYEKAWCLKSLDRNQEASQVYAALLNEGLAGEFNTHAAVELAGLFMNDKRFKQASRLLRPIYDQLASADDSTPVSLREQLTYRLGVSEFELGNMAGTAEVFNSFEQQFENSDLIASTHFYAGEAFFQIGQYSDSVRHLSRVTKFFKDDPVYEPSLLRLGESLSAAQKWSKSERVFNEYLERFPDSESWYQAQFGIGWALEHQKRYEDGIRAYQAVATNHQGPTAARAQFQIGECYFATKQYDQAVRELLKVDILYAYPEWSAAALFEAARCFVKLGKLVEARSHFKLVSQQHSDTRWAPLASQRLTELSSAGIPGR